MSETLWSVKGIAELFLVHDRPIARHVDDSIVRILMGRELVLRRARGYAPLPIRLKTPAPAVLAVGAHLKNTIAAAADQDVFLSQHIGDLETAQALEAFQRVISSFQNLYDWNPTAVCCDLHPDYLSTRHAHNMNLPVVAIQHHYAHVLSCMAENELEPPVLGVSWDGTGYGTDGTVWGGEFLRVNENSFERVAHFRKFRLPGGEQAIREPRRAALGVLYEIFGDGLFQMAGLPPLHDFTSPELRVLQAMLAQKINSPETSSAGRIFDAVAAILDIRQKSRFEGQAAMELEFAIEDETGEDAYPISASCGVIDWEPLFHSILEDQRHKVAGSRIAAKFHNALVESIILVAKRAGEEKIVLTGGCFQNRCLTERAVTRLEAEGFRPFWHQRIPPNDGGIALGQILAAFREGFRVPPQTGES